MSEHIARIFDAIEDMLTHKPRSVSTCRYFAEHDATFRRACFIAGIPATRRQASKWGQQRGRVPTRSDGKPKPLLTSSGTRPGGASEAAR